MSEHLRLPLRAAATTRAALRERIRAQASGRGLKGTVLLAEEGINLFLAGAPEGVRGFVAWLHEDARFADAAAQGELVATPCPSASCW